MDSSSVCAEIARKFLGTGSCKLHWLWGAVGLDPALHIPSPGSVSWELAHPAVVARLCCGIQQVVMAKPLLCFAWERGMAAVILC